MRKTPQLSDADRQAVDLLLNHAAGNATAGPAGSVEPRRVAALRQLLSNLDAMATVETPADLVARTVARTESATIVPSARPAVGTTFHA